jgi:Protein of unknown function (DUF1640)
MTAAFDTLAYTQKLRSTGVTPDQAEGHAEALKAALAETVATRADLKDVETTLKADIAAVRTDLQTTEAALKTDSLALRHEIELVRRDVQAVESRIIIRLTAVVVTTVVVTGAILGILTVLF